MPKTVSAHTDDRIVDSYPFSCMRGAAGLQRTAKALRAAAVEGVALYLGVATPDHVQACHAAGLYVLGVTLAGRYDGDLAVAQAHRLGLTAGAPGGSGGTSLFLDVEGKTAYETAPDALTASIKGWALKVAAAGYLPGLYLGAPQPLTSEELYALPVHPYWKGQGSARDRNGHLVEPACGWCMHQAYPSVMRGGVLTDGNQVQQDFKGRVPAVCAA